MLTSTHCHGTQLHINRVDGHNRIGYALHAGVAARALGALGRQVGALLQRAHVEAGSRGVGGLLGLHQQPPPALGILRRLREGRRQALHVQAL